MATGVPSGNTLPKVAQRTPKCGRRDENGSKVGELVRRVLRSTY
jgi:hypothetical protein